MYKLPSKIPRGICQSVPDTQQDALAWQHDEGLKKRLMNPIAVDASEISFPTHRLDI